MGKVGVYRQFAGAAIASISVLIVGAALGWPSPVLLRLEQGDPIRLTSSQISWLASLIYIGNFFSPFPTGRLMDSIGRRNSLLLLTVCPLFSWILIYYVSNPYMLYASRFLSGLWTGAVTTVYPVYAAEISSAKIRGSLSTFFQLSTNIGILFEYAIGPWVSYWNLALISGVIPIIFFCSFILIPESPYWYVMKGKRNEAIKSLKWFQPDLSNDQTIAKIEELENAFQKKTKSKASLRSVLWTPGTRKALLIVEVLAMCQRMSGVSAIVVYISTTLPADGAWGLTTNECALIMGVIWVLSVPLSTFLVDSSGRRPLLFVSSAGCGLATSAVAIWFYLDETPLVDVSHVSWIPFVGFVLCGFFFSIGLGPVANTLQGELFSPAAKSTASGITALVFAFSSFLVNKVYISIAETSGMSTNYWIFSGVCYFCAAFIYFFVIETKGKTLEEIQRELNGEEKPTDDEIAPL